MIETELYLEKFHWEISQDKSHQYYVCESHNMDEFKDLVIYIKNHGYVVTIQGKSYVCVDIGEYLYWTMWYSTEETNFINRIHIDRIGQRSGILTGLIVKLTLCMRMYLEWIMHPYGFNKPAK